MKLLTNLKLAGEKAQKNVEQVLRWTATKVHSIAFYSIPQYSRWGFYPQVIFVLVALMWFQYRPEWSIQGPGVAMAFLAIAAIVMAVRGSDSTRMEGVFWIVISVCLFWGEMHFISVERKAHDVEQAELRQREENTGREQTRAFGQLIKEGNQLLKSLDAETALTAKNLEHITGGDGYCWLVPVTPLPVALGGDPKYQSGNYWQLALKNSGKVVLPTCDVRFMPFPSEKELKGGVANFPPFLSFHFEKVPIMGRRYYRYTSHFIKGDRIYSGVIETPTRSFIEVIKFAPDPNNPARDLPTCMVATSKSEKTLETECNPQK